MATEQQYIVGGNGARVGATQLCALAVNGNTTVKGQIVVPANSWLKAIAVETPVGITGAPTNCNVNIGTTDGGTDVMAATAAGSQGHVAGTIAAGAHEMCHLRQEMIADRSHHGAKFKRMAAQVCRAHGFDIKTF